MNVWGDVLTLLNCLDQALRVSCWTDLSPVQFATHNMTDVSAFSLRPLFIDEGRV